MGENRFSPKILMSSRLFLLSIFTASPVFFFGSALLLAQTNSAPTPEKPKVPASIAPADSTTEKKEDQPKEPEVLVSTLEPSELKNWDQNSGAVQALLREALDLTKKKLKYAYGSADPKNGGMDCSGTMYYLLRRVGVKDPPRQANLFYTWVRKEGLFRAVVSTNNESFELDEMKPGDLMFWTGTYNIDRDPPVTHVMIYLGRRKDDNRRVMMGASEGRRYDGKSRYGVSVFDFRLPGFPPPKSYKDDGGRFIGYAAIPRLPVLPPLRSPDSLPQIPDSAQKPDWNLEKEPKPEPGSESLPPAESDRVPETESSPRKIKPEPL
jgi:cell wall-associated NlpC family hydrolase